MARETHPGDGSRESHAPRSAPEGSLPGLGSPRTLSLTGDPRRGAALEAPTAPHATLPIGDVKVLTGPARFWSTRRIRVALAVAFVLSMAIHWFVGPWTLLPSSAGLELKDPEGELSIPVDLLGEDVPPEPPPAPAPVETAAQKDPTAPGANKPDAAPPPRDAGIADADKLPVDAGMLAVMSDGGVGEGDGSAATDAGDLDGGVISDASGLVASAEGGAAPGSNGPRDPESMFGLSKTVNAGPQNVVLGVNTAVIRKHPVGARMGPLLQAIPQWKDFLKGSQSLVDPTRDTDWILIYGPSLRHTDRCAVLVRYNVSDESVDRAVSSIAHTYDKGGPFDAGVPGVTASRGHADNAERIFLRPQSKLLVIVPPSHAHEAALAYKNQKPRGPSQKEAMRLVVKNPTNQVSIPGLKFKDSLKELRLWIVPRSDGGADVFAEGDCTDESAAADSADALSDLIRSQNSIGVRLATRGLLNNAKVVADGTKIKLEVTATQEQLEAILQLVAASLNTQVTPAPTGTAP